MKKTIESSTQFKHLELLTALMLIGWYAYAAYTFAPMFPQPWATGILYPVWLVLVFWALAIAVVLPSGFVTILAFKILRKWVAFLVVFIAMYIYDGIVRKSFPGLYISPGFALAALYVYVVFFLSKRFR